MKQARVAWNGTVTEAEPLDSGRLLLPDGTIVDEHEVMWLPPVEPRTIVALGLNYADHAGELSFAAPKEPLFFFKGKNTLIGHRGRTVRPAGVDMMHYECELAVVIGRPARRVKAEQAYDYIWGYTIANDYAVRDYLENYYRPNFRVKNRDRTTPLGPWIVSHEEVGDPMALALRTYVNGALVQEGYTGDMIFSIPYLLEYITSFMTLAPGDLILTGTPKGAVNVQPGDEVVAEIERIGRLINYIE
ncbi:2-hydroxyhepta-2,4-diene-1,7-dioate isomerase [Geobacillus sp. 47C-IIb]|jgi:5-oxopent-3-ene-1,2,5-tricarboxylate decarboxylase/2-hydroxyhepta-2,4-diene-1,7-dioate isomerase|uniref:fumarylacetoacetate hydrolase family protein n=1 Tax=Geobacillus TaxID=129337 RepID=UPI00017E3E69|nr:MULTISPECIES: fumarylacetoacetate hydrolase family protein [Geobacillus]ARP44044.1 5-carboxymethyl-2-oxo-hex-3-ene-1,7-dioate decarboxylase [Geobacillus thermodenitrificans]KQB91975.1 4-hydroxyphenylacetate degradation bifunctional isomerase/decarboxylase [Geobacillus sp. PA-3]MED3905885.1 fumarylacetoacetate hydrolase family protein [Geobacillus thermodenitrificans]OQP09770.1 2-hydroxyhepta-2,4-diene-1,7-dioate isomerase [Geobacillus sp. 47C-IIb]QNU32508.1 fumarylacetoacetate hydrolase fam